jgi:hypothetical protein|tara:strand:+ start:328 stop:537 length:210 start_codon:yes stop_codon:yes gene_type:complete
MIDKKINTEKNIPKGTLLTILAQLNVVYKALSTALTVRDIQTIFEREGIADKYVWKENKLGHLTAWEKR